MSRLYHVLLAAVLVAFAIRILWWGIQPLVPFALAFLVMVYVAGIFKFRDLWWPLRR